LNAAGVVAALAAEARALGPTQPRGEGLAMLADGNLVAVSGLGPKAARGAAQRLMDAGATSLVSWGLAGGLDPGLEAGAVCVPREVIAADGSRLGTARCWQEFLSSSVPPGRRVGNDPLLTAEYALETPADKSAAHRATGACAVDMESSAIAQVAEAYGVPFIAVRVIVDTALDEIPPAVAGASRGGKLRVSRLILGLIRSPLQIAPLLRLARRYRVALRSLRAVAALGKLEPPSAASGATSGATAGAASGASPA
jgi:hopanoid-associated phosphorylase